ncbi:MAG: glycosyltransferase family 2 protein [Pseudomonadota bacterium]|nr:glycosyltransferase family 2 protein [Pseudomonadota bacterium]MDQ2705368.1 glycosyltransferase family 2 protein [Pseudomonadota bacterium]
MPKFTAILPLYNKADTINRAIASVLAQSIDDCEVIVVDDGSTDGSVDVIESAHLSAIRLVRQANAGPGRARNAGAALATGEFLTFLDADDEWEPGFLEAAGAALENHPDCAAYVAAYSSTQKDIHEDILLRVIPETGPRTIDGFDRPIDMKAYVDCFHSSSSVVRRETFRRYGGYYDRDRCLYGEDSYFWLQVALGERVYFDRRILTHFHVEDSSLGVKQKGRHPRRPALVHPEPLRRSCPPERRAQLEALLAFLRLIETQKLVAQGKFHDISGLRRAFPWPAGKSDPMITLREVRVSALGLVNRGRSLIAPGGDSPTVPN